MRVTCVICADLFDEVKSMVVTPCGHIFHEECIYQWVDRSSTCPECRQKVTFTTVRKLYFSFSATQVCSDSNLENEVHTLQAELKSKETALADMRDEKEELRKYVRIAEEKAALSEQKALNLKQELVTVKLAMKDLKRVAARMEDVQETNKSLFKQIEHFRNVATVISGTQKDVEDIIAGLGSGPDSIKQMATYFSLVKRELKNVTSSKQQQQNQIVDLQKNLNIQMVKLKKQLAEIKCLREQIETLEKENLVLSKQVQKLYSNKASEAVVSYESPMPQRVKHISEGEDKSLEVTPVSERITVEPIAKSMKLSNLSRPSLSSSRDHNNFEVKMDCINSLREKLQSDNEGTSVRFGYDGFGGHGKFIVRSSSLFSKLPPKRKGHKK